MNEVAGPKKSTKRRELLFGLDLNALTMDEVLDLCRDAIVSRTPLLIGVVNAAKIVKLRSDKALRDSLLECDVIVADGQAVVWASRLLGRRLPERIAGIDLFEQLLTMAHNDAKSVYLLGARPEVNDRLASRLLARFPGLQIAGRHDGYFADTDGARIAADIRSSHADMLFLGMVSPKKEIFLGSYGDSLEVPVLHGVGGSFDIFAGITKRAPVAWQRMGLEWLYRLVQEPRRMWKRYLTTNTGFIALTLKERIHRTPRYQLNAAAQPPTD